MMRILLLFFFLFTSAACVNEDLIFLENDGAEMPIVVRGNKNSGVFILLLHGGPGNGTYIWEGYFNEIEKNYAIVYWNQRAAGESQGNSKPGQMTISQFVEDTDKVLTLVNQLYGNPEIFIMGHSWGGLLGTAYLIDNAGNPGQNSVAGWIEVDGAHNKVLGEQYSKQWMIDYATRQIAEGNNASYWNRALGWYNTYSGRLTYTSLHYTEYLNKANAYFYGQEAGWYGISDFLFGRPNGFDLLLNGTYNDKTMGEEVASTDLTPQMGMITVPSLILWGRHDGAIPWQMAEDAYNALGTVPSEKSIVYFENSAHSPMIEENEAFTQAVISFIENYR